MESGALTDASREFHLVEGVRIAAAGTGTSAAIVAGFDDDAAVFELDNDAAAIRLIAFSVKPAVKLAIIAAETGAERIIFAAEIDAFTIACICGLDAFGFDLASCFQLPCTDGHLIDRTSRMECGCGEHHAHVLGVAQRHTPTLGVGLVDPGARLRGVDPLRHELRRRNDHFERDLSAAHVDAVLDHEANRQLEALDRFPNRAADVPFSRPVRRRGVLVCGMRSARSLRSDRLEQLRIDGTARVDFGNILVRRTTAPRVRARLELSRDEHEAVDRRLDSPNRRLGNAVAAFPAAEEIRVRITLRPNESQRRRVQPVGLGTRQHAHRVRVVKPARKQKRERRRLHRGIEGRRADVVQGAEQVLEGRFGVEAFHDLAETARRDPRTAEQRAEGEREKAAGERLVICEVVRMGAEIAPGIEKRVAAVFQGEAGDLANPTLVAQLNGAANLLIALEFRVRQNKRAEIRGGLPVPRSREQDVGIARRGRKKRAVGHERATVAINVTPDAKLVFRDELD